MKLAQWLKSNNRTPEWLAAKVRVDVVSIGRYIAGTRRPDWDVLPRIIKVTDGEVTAEDLCGPKRAPKRTRRPRVKGATDPDRRVLASV